jgi:hypothetical protein
MAAVEVFNLQEKFDRAKEKSKATANSDQPAAGCEMTKTTPGIPEK